MGKIYMVEDDGRLVEADSRLRAIGPYIFEVSERHAEELRADESIIVPVPWGLGMGWPGLKDLGITADFVTEPETIKLDEGTKL